MLNVIVLMALPVSAAFAAPKQAETLPSGWVLESDDDYSSNDDYTPPPNVSGLFMHGFEADDSIDVDNGTVTLRASVPCAKTVAFADERGFPESFPDRTQTEFWFYRSGDQALYLSRKWDYDFDGECHGVAREVRRIVRIVWFNGTVTFAESSGGGTARISTEKLAGNAYYPIPKRLIKMDETGLRETETSPLVRKEPKRKRVDRDPVTGVERTCFGLSQFFFFHTECYFSGRSQWRGALLSAESQGHAGEGQSEMGAAQFKPAAIIDGRLFEWDREISAAPKSAPKGS